MDTEATPTTDHLALVANNYPKPKRVRETPSEAVARWADENRRRAEILADAIGRGKATTPQELAQLARKLRMKSERVELLISTPSIQALAKPRIRAKAMVGIAAAIPSMVELAKVDPTAFTALSKVAELQNSGINVQTNVALIDQRRGQDPEQVQAFIERFRKAQRKTLDRSVEEAS